MTVSFEEYTDWISYMYKWLTNIDFLICKSQE